MPLDLSRRGFLRGAGATLLCAPAIVRVSSLMAIKPMTLGNTDTLILGNGAGLEQLEAWRPLLHPDIITREAIRILEQSQDFIRMVDSFYKTPNPSFKGLRL